jgi:uncharacterized membrane protein
VEGRNIGLIALGIMLLVIGLIAYSYESQTWSDYYQRWNGTGRYPYQVVGIILIVAGIVFIPLGLLYPARKTPPPPPT